MDLIEGGGVFSAPAAGEDVHWVEHLRSAHLSVGTYSLPAGAPDEQTPHREDEVYVVVSGRARFTGGGTTVDVGPGSTLFVPAHEVHRFHDVSEDLSVVVVFAPPESGP